MNRFNALLDDSDDEKVVPVVQKKVAVKKEETPIVAITESKKDSKTNFEGKDKEGDRKTNHAPNRKEPATSTVLDNQPVKIEGDAELKSKDDHRGGRGYGRGDYQKRNPGGRGEYQPKRDNDAPQGDRPAPRKREFDRRSGTGRSGEQKKGGAGRGGFGNINQEAIEAEKNPENFVQPVVTTEPETVEIVEEVVEVVPEVVVPVALSYDEFIAKRNESRANTEVFGVKTTVRTVQADFSGLNLTKEEKTTFIGAEQMLKAKSPKVLKDQRSMAKTVVLDVGFKRPETESQDDDRRGGRGGGRGDRAPRSNGGGRGGTGYQQRSSNANQSRFSASVNINDADSFPSL